jgi:dTDP-4-dehydrorhamnose 3,5-epimerase
MEKIETGFTGLFIIKPVIYSDSRGYFFESFNIEAFRKTGLSFIPIQDNESKSSHGVIRGLHYQLKPHDQAKLVRVVEGRIYDVALDLRKSSPTYGKWYGIELDSESKLQLLIPRGFAHGFSVLSELAIVEYKVDNLFDKQAERGIAITDPVLDIDWKLGDTTPIISEKDRDNPPLDEAEMNF